MDDIKWSQILSSVKEISPSIEALLRSSKLVEFNGNNLKLSVCYKFHKDKLEENKNKKIIEDIVFKVFDKNIRIECQLTEIPKKTELTQDENKNIMAVAEEIFS